MDGKHNQLVQFLKALKRKRWLAMAIAWMVCALGWAGIYFMPDHYEGSARVYVDTDTILKPLMSGLAVQPNLVQKVAIMTRTVMSRPNLERISRLSGLDANVNSVGDRERLIKALEKKILMSGSAKDNLYTVTYQHTDPSTAKRVVESLLSVLVDSSVGEKRADSKEARRFIDERLKEYQSKLNEAEEAVKNFKREHLLLTPGVGEGYFSRVKAAGDALSNAQQELREQSVRRDELKRQLAQVPSRPRAAQIDTGSADAGPSFSRVTDIEKQIADVEQDLARLRLNYTEEYPQLVSTKRLLASLTEQLTNARALEPTAPRRSASRPLDMDWSMDRQLHEQAVMALVDAEANVAMLTIRVEEYRKRYDSLQAAANAVPEVEAEYSKLVRDYEVTKKNYEELLQRRDSAKMSDEMESQKLGMVFRIIDPPRVSVAPVWPNRPLFLSGVIIASLIIAVGIGILAGQFRQTIDDADSLFSFAHYDNLDVAGTITLAGPANPKTASWKPVMLYLSALIGLLGTYGTLMMSTLLHQH